MAAGSQHARDDRRARADGRGVRRAAAARGLEHRRRRPHRLTAERGGGLAGMSAAARRLLSH
jgi:hypothetical protein